MSAPNGKGQNLSLTPHQLGAMLVLDSLIVGLQTGANQLGGFLGLKREGDILANAMHSLAREKELLMSSWAKQVQVFPAAALPPPPVIPSKE